MGRIERRGILTTNWNHYHFKINKSMVIFIPFLHARIHQLLLLIHGYILLSVVFIYFLFRQIGYHIY